MSFLLPKPTDDETVAGFETLVFLSGCNVYGALVGNRTAFLELGCFDQCQLIIISDVWELARQETLARQTPTDRYLC
jgi:hypothetical protein